ncbi:MAG: hypothetical protein MI922_17555 [Bacteroidales bacterium]|nr:hypothetical protein [Bacteroidales bacterium]
MDNVKFIEDYFLGNLNDDELRDFHLRLENDDHFRSDYQLITEINECIAQDDVQELRNTLSGMFEKKK